MNQNLYQHITDTLDVKPTRHAPLHGGMIGEVYRLDLADGRTIVAKVAQGQNQTLDIEGYMLRYLAEHSNLPVPEVLHSEPSLLLMTFIEGSSHWDNRAEQHAADLLAALHNIRAPQFGLERDTLIGPLHQPNPQTASWVEFFRDQRLLYMARVANQHGMPSNLLKRIEAFAAKLDDFIEEPDYPSLIHGDLWTTNILAQDGRITGFIDPAIYYGHAEIELAYTTLFGTFGATFNQGFFSRYQEHRPITPGFMEQRRHIYNLYPLLVHVRLFGGGYASSVASTLSSLGF